LSAAAVATAVAALLFTWSRLFLGMDLRDESYYVLVPWRWVLGDRPFAQEKTAFQLPGLIEYPFLKLFGLLRGNDSTGLVLYTRHLYLLLMIGVAVAVFLLLRRLVRWQLALPIACVSATYIFWDTPQLSYNTLALAFLTLGVVFGAWVVVLKKGRGYALASGAAFGFAVVAYPTLLFVMPFFGVLLVLSHGRRVVAVLAEGAFAQPPDPDGPPTGRMAWRSLSGWAAGGALVLVPVGVLLASFGLENVRDSFKATISGAHTIGQLGGAAKEVAVVQGIWSLLTSRPLVVVAMLVTYLVFRRYPRLGRALLSGIPFVLYLAVQTHTSSFVVVYVVLAPYLFLFVPRSKRVAGAQLLIWVWAGALMAGSMTAYTSAAGWVNSPVGLAPALMVSGLFLAWALEAAAALGSQADVSASAAKNDAGRSRVGGARWLAFAVLVAVVAVTIAFQFQFQQREVPYRELTSRFDSGPWWGIKVMPKRRALMDSFAAALRATSRPGDKLLVFYEAPGYYLYWNGAIASDSSWLWAGLPGRLPPEEIAYFRDHRVVPTLVVRVLGDHQPAPAEIASGDGGFGYPAVLAKPGFVFYRKPPGESASDVLRRLTQ